MLIYPFDAARWLRLNRKESPMAALLIGVDERAAIATLRAYAEANVIDPQAALALYEQDTEAFSQIMAAMTVHLPIGYRVTYSHEQQTFGIARHLSVSIDRPGKMAHPEAIEMILTEFGMQPLKSSVGIWIEDIDEHRKAVNLLQPLMQ
jgi:hypothetical protein